MVLGVHNPGLLRSLSRAAPGRVRILLGVPSRLYLSCLKHSPVLSDSERQHPNETAM